MKISDGYNKNTTDKMDWLFTQKRLPLKSVLKGRLESKKTRARHRQKLLNWFMTDKYRQQDEGGGTTLQGMAPIET